MEAPPPRPPVHIAWPPAGPTPLDRDRAHANSTIFLIGSAPNGLLHQFRGRYDRLDRQYDRRHMYLRSADGAMMWHDDAYWLIGSAEDAAGSAPSSRGWLHARDPAAIPESVKAVWEIGDGRLGWLPAPALRVAAGPTASASAAAEAEGNARALEDAAEAVWLVGACPCGLWREWLGGYDRRSGGRLVGGRHVYVQRDDAQRLLWYGDGVFWWAGPAAHEGEPRGALRVRDGALTPEGVNATWEVGDSAWLVDSGTPSWSGRWDMGDSQTGWLQAPQLRVMAGAAGQAASRADGNPSCGAVHGARAHGLRVGRCSEVDSTVIPVG